MKHLCKTIYIMLISCIICTCSVGCVHSDEMTTSDVTDEELTIFRCGDYYYNVDGWTDIMNFSSYRDIDENDNEFVYTSYIASGPGRGDVEGAVIYRNVYHVDKVSHKINIDNPAAWGDIIGSILCTLMFWCFSILLIK